MKYLIILLCLLLILCIKFKIKIKFKTFFKRGFLPVRGNFGVYCYCGKQGKGKTYSVVEYMIDNKNNSIYFCNVSGIKGVDYFHFTGFIELIYLKEIIDFNSVEEDYSDLLSFIKTKFSEERSEYLFSLVVDLKANKRSFSF